MPVIVLQFSRDGSLGSRMIRWYGGVHRWSHVDAVLPNGDLLGARDEAESGFPAGVQIRTPGYAAFTATERVQIPCLAETRDAFYTAIKSQVGKPYSWRTILGFALGRRIGDPRGWVCDTLQFWALLKERVLPPALHDLIDVVTPDDLYLMAVTAAHLYHELGEVPRQATA